jgi:hypothetical protein
VAAARGKYVDDIAADLRPAEVPLQPWALAVYEQRKSGAYYKDDPPANCLPPGVPRMGATPLAWQVILEPTWLGYSTGNWDGNVLVVDTKGVNGKAWLDTQGKPSTDALHVIERFHRKDFGRMDIQITIDDPKAYTRPWAVAQSVNLLPDSVLVEFVCNENNVVGKN